MLKTFRTLKALGEFRRRHMPYVETLEDLEMIREIGFSQAMGNPLSLKQLFMHGIASVATVQRRLSRLVRLGIVEQSKAEHDRRVRKLTLTPAAQKVCSSWGRVMRKR